MIRIRKATVADAGTIVEFQLKMAMETEGLELDRPTVVRGVNYVFDNRSHGSYILAEANDKVVGSLMLTPEWSDWRHGWVMWIQSVYVLPECRKEGVFKKLYGHVKKMAMQDPQVMGLRLYVDRTNEAAQKVYQAIGMDGEHYRLFEWMKPT